MSTDLIVKHFEGKPVTFRVDGEKLTLTMKEAGELYEYKHPTEDISKLYQKHKDEYDNDCTFLGVSPMQVSVHIPPRRERLFTLEGLILLGMHSQQPVAKKVRRWLRKIGKEVAVTGHYRDPHLSSALLTLTQTLETITKTQQLQSERMDSLSRRVQEQDSRWAHTFIPSNRDISTWLTPTQRLRQLNLQERLPKGFNAGGAFDRYAADEHKKEFGCYPEARSRRFLQKLPEWVVEPCREIDDFLRRTCRKYLKHEWPPNKQTRLKLINFHGMKALKEQRKAMENLTTPTS